MTDRDSLRLRWAVVVTALALPSTTLVSGGEGCDGGNRADCDRDTAASMMHNHYTPKAPTLCLRLTVPSKLPPLGPPHAGKRKAKGCVDLTARPGKAVADLGRVAGELGVIFGLTQEHVVWGVQEQVGGPVLPLSFGMEVALVQGADAGGGKAWDELRLVLRSRPQQSFQPRSTAPSPPAGSSSTPQTATAESALAGVPLIDLGAVAKASSKSVRAMGKELVRALKDVGWARVKVGDGALQRYTRAVEHGEAALEVLARRPELQPRALIKCTRTGKITGVEQRGADTTYLHVRRLFARGGTFAGGHHEGAERIDNGDPTAPTQLPYAGVPGLPSGLQESLDGLYDDLNEIGAATLHLIACGMGLDRVDATVFSDSLLTPDAGFHRGDPLSDSYFRMFRYAGRDDHANRGGGGRCFGNAHSDVGVVTVAPIGAVAGLDFLVPEPIRVVPWAAYLDGPSVETWQWIPAEALLKERVANGTSTPDEWIVFVGEAVARAAGLHPVVHRVCVPTPGAPEDDHADILRMSVPFFQRPGAFAQIIDAKKRKKASGHRGEVVMREFFQTLKQRVYNRLSLTEFCC